MMRGCCTSWVSASWRNASNSDRSYLTAAKEQCAASYHDTAQPNASAADLATITDWQADALFATTPSASRSIENRSTCKGFVIMSATLSSEETRCNGPPGCETVSCTTPKLTRWFFLVCRIAADAPDFAAANAADESVRMHQGTVLSNTSSRVVAVGSVIFLAASLIATSSASAVEVAAQP